MGNISKLPNQCQNISKFLKAISKLPNQCSKLPNQCKMLAHRVCASILHWLGSFHFFGIFYNKFWYYPINVKCLSIGYVQAFYIDWVVLKFFGDFGIFWNMYCLSTLIGQFSVISQNCLINVQKFIDWAIFQNCPINVRIYGTFLGQFQNCPINVKGLLQAFYIDWVLLPNCSNYLCQ